MDKAAVVREFLGWVDKNRHWSLRWIGGAGENSPVFDREFDQALNEFVASQEQASAVEWAVRENRRAVVQSQIHETLGRCAQTIDTVWQQALKEQASEPASHLISPEWTPTPETVRQWKEAWSERAKC